MEEHISQLTVWFNHVFGSVALWILHAVHVQPADYDLPIPEYLVMSIVVFLLCTVLALVLRSRLQVDRPGAMQQCAEMLLTNPLGFGVKDLLEENVGHDYERYIPFVGSIGIFILFSNLLGLIPALSSPTGGSVPIAPLACAILVFIYFNAHGLRQNGPIGYVKTFSGPVWWLSWLIAPVEMISFTARILSLTVRLWANIFASDLIYVIFLGLLLTPTEWAWSKNPALGAFVGLFPLVIPIAFLLLHVFVSIIQAYVFTILPAIYIGLAVNAEH
ncbi:MAG TPA: F0F1 ATP synthase subunit A [Candidatus Eisenbacteria bacterium]|nr:F0F1 ATP synthase subunit A [Candidatus Eisenbacteria bacterium]